MEIKSSSSKTGESPGNCAPAGTVYLAGSAGAGVSCAGTAFCGRGAGVACAWVFWVAPVWGEPFSACLRVAEVCAWAAGGSAVLAAWETACVWVTCAACPACPAGVGDGVLVVGAVLHPATSKSTKNANPGLFMEGVLFYKFSGI